MAENIYVYLRTTCLGMALLRRWFSNKYSDNLIMAIITETTAEQHNNFLPVSLVLS